MIYYLISAIFPIACWLIYDALVKKEEFNKDKTKKFMAFIAILPIFLLYVLRYKRVGVDTIGYVNFFESDIRHMTFGEIFNVEALRVEVGYRFYVKLISLITDNYTVYFLFNGIIMFGSIYRFALKYSKNPFLVIYCFITLGTYQLFETGLRQALAISICLFAVDFIKDKKLVRFVLVVFLASLFHKSAWIFLMAYPLSLIKSRQWTIAAYIFLAGVFTVGFTFFQNVMNDILGYSYTVEETGNGGVFMLVVLVLTAFSIYASYQEGNREKVTATVEHLSLLTSLFWILRLVSRTAERVSFYFIVGLYAYFASQSISVSDKFMKFLQWLLILGCLVLFIYRGGGGDYAFFWSR